MGRRENEEGAGSSAEIGPRPRLLADKKHYVTVLVPRIALVTLALAIHSGIIRVQGVQRAKRERNEIGIPAGQRQISAFWYITEKVLLSKGIGVPVGGSAGGVASENLRVVDGFSRVEKGGQRLGRNSISSAILGGSH